VILEVLRLLNGLENHGFKVCQALQKSIYCIELIDKMDEKRR